MTRKDYIDYLTQAYAMQVELHVKWEGARLSSYDKGAPFAEEIKNRLIEQLTQLEAELNRSVA